MVLNLGICDIHIPNIHGINDDSTNEIYNYHILNMRIELEEFYRHDYLEYLSIMTSYWNNINEVEHPTIKNINSIIHHPNYVNIEIIEIHKLVGGEEIVIKKTIGLKLFQRHIKKWYANYIINKNNYINKMKFPKNLYNRKIHGNYPKISLHN